MSDSILHNEASSHAQLSNSSAEVIAAIVAASVNVISGILAIIINALLLHTLVQNHKSASRILICNLAVTDLLTGFVVQPSYIVHIIMDLKGTYSRTALFVFNFSGYLVCGISLVTAGGMSVDRLLATLIPFRYKVYSKPRLFAGIVVFIWVQGIGFVALYLTGIINNALAQLAFILTVCFAVLSFVVSYAIILKGYRVRERRITQGASLQTANQRQRRQAKVTKTFALMVIALCLMYFPMIVVKSLLWKASSTQLVTLNIANRVANTIVFLNSLLNPVLYCYGNNAVRAQIIERIRNITYLMNRRRSTESGRDPGVIQPQAATSFS